MNIPISDVLKDYNTLTLILTYIPMVAVAIFVAFCFYRLEYGHVGRLLIIGLIILIASLSFGLLYNIERNPVYQVIAGTTRLFGWTTLAMAFLAWWLDIDGSIP